MEAVRQRMHRLGTDLLSAGGSTRSRARPAARCGHRRRPLRSMPPGRKWWRPAANRTWTRKSLTACCGSWTCGPSPSAESTTAEGRFGGRPGFLPGRQAAAPPVHGLRCGRVQRRRPESQQFFAPRRGHYERPLELVSHLRQFAHPGGERTHTAQQPARDGSDLGGRSPGGPGIGLDDAALRDRRKGRGMQHRIPGLRLPAAAIIAAAKSGT